MAESNEQCLWARTNIMCVVFKQLLLGSLENLLASLADECMGKLCVIFQEYSGLQKTGVGSLSLLQGIFPTQGSNPGLLHGRQTLCHPRYQGSPQNTFKCQHFLIKYLGRCNGACVLLTSKDRGQACCCMPYKVQDHVPSCSSAKK